MAVRVRSILNLTEVIFGMLRKKRGFTLIELLIVIAIILILIAIALPNFLEAQIRARVTKANGELRSIATALFDYNTALISASKEGIFPPAGGVAQGGWQPWRNSSTGMSPNSPNNNAHACSIIWVLGSFYDSKGDASATDAAPVPTGDVHYDLRVMTSPIEALTATPSDPFKNNGGFTAQYDYFATDLRDSFALRSLGPDGVAAVGCGTQGFNCEGNSIAWGSPSKGGPSLMATVFEGTTHTEFGCEGCDSLSEAIRVGTCAYSPTNGTKSDGDVWRFSQ